MTEAFPTGSKSPDLSQSPIWEGESPNAEAEKARRTVIEDAELDQAEQSLLVDSEREAAAIDKEVYGDPDEVAKEDAPADPKISPYRR